MSAHASKLRSLYRSVLRELPKRPISKPSPVHLRLRETFSTPAPSAEHFSRQLEEGEQFVQYARAQRQYATLLERYNPSLYLEDEERIRLTARRVGMEMPVEVKKD